MHIKTLRQMKTIIQKTVAHWHKHPELPFYNPKIPSEGIFYKEREAVGFKNLTEKETRVKEGGPFEWPNMVALNQAIMQFIGDAIKIVNVGSGTGTFELFASTDPKRHLVASEFDPDCITWCKKNRPRENITYCSLSMTDLLDKYRGFDLAVCVDVIEHVADFRSFLGDFAMLANRAIITTPNRDRDLDAARRGTPDYYQHVREWDAGELYWVLKNYYGKVTLYSMPDPYVPATKEIGFMSTLSPLIAVCER